MTTQRTDWVDYAKGFGILFVVYAHLLSSGYHSGVDISEHYFHLSDSGVYSFHMPLFFFLAGLFVWPSLEKRGTIHFCKEKIRLIAYPYIIWSIIQGSVELIFSGQSHRGMDAGDLFTIPFLPLAQFWFLYALLLMYIAFALLRRLKVFFHTVLIVSALVLYFFPLPTEVMALHGFSTGFLYFVVGYMATKYDRLLKSIPLAITICLLLLQVISIFIVFEQLISPTRLTDGSHPLYFLYLSGVGILVWIGISQYLAKKQWGFFIKILGVHSIRIYLVHMLAGVAVRVILLSLFSVENPVIHMVLGVGGGVVIPIVIYRISQYLRFPYLFELNTSR